MRSRSKKTNGYTVYAVSGTNTISFAVDCSEANTKGLLGFAVERIDSYTGDRKFMAGYKVFKDLIPKPEPNMEVSTYTHPIQSCVWDDFTCYPDREYEYLFYPLKGKPTKIDRSTKPVSVVITTEALFTNGEHDIFFNRGVASSQAYNRKFYNLRPDQITSPEMKQRALDWLSRDLDEAILRFIGQAKKGDTLLGCFYEFRYEPVAQAFADAYDRGVNVKIIIDAKNKIIYNKQGEPQPPFPREENLAMIKKVGLPLKKSDGVIYQRAARTDDIQHNKFIVYIDGSDRPKAVWTGSTNISLGGIHGQTNVGHWVRNKVTAERFRRYWEVLSKDPGAKDADTGDKKKKKNDDLKKAVMSLQPDIDFTGWTDIPTGITPVFSPRRGTKMMETYVEMLDNAADSACITLAFGINKKFKEQLADNTDKSALTFMLLEKADAPKKNSKTPFVSIDADQNVYKAWGSYIEDKELEGWAREVSTRHLKLNQHVAYVHSKFMLADPLSADPVVVSGSANFSDASTTDNDENMLIIRGNTRVADIYFTEFNRLFNHYYFRAVYNNLKEKKQSSTASIFLDPDDKWLKKYKKGLLRYKKVEMFKKMEGFS